MVLCHGSPWKWVYFLKMIFRIKKNKLKCYEIVELCSVGDKNFLRNFLVW